MFLFKDNLSSVHSLFIDIEIELTVNHALSHVWTKLIYHMYLLHKAHHNLLTHGGHLKLSSHQKTQKNVKKKMDTK